jgi:hypothetical protein
VLRTPHFDIYFYPSEQDAASVAARMAERWYVRLSTVFHHPLSGRQPLILYATQSQFQQTNVVGGVGEGTGGVTEGLRRRIVLPTGGTLDDLNHVIGHELVHAFQYDITGSGNPNTRGRLPAATDLPLWFIEGMAEYLSLGPAAPLTAMWMRGGVQDSVKDSLPSYRQLEDPRFFPYRYGQALLAYVGGEWGDERIGDLLRQAGRMRSIDQAIRGGPESHARSAGGALARSDARGLRFVAGQHRGAECVRSATDRGARGCGTVQRVTVDQPGRQAGDVLLRSRPLLDRPLPGRRPNG